MNAGEKLIARGVQQVARNMIASGIALDAIAKCTGFSQSELKELAKQEVIQHSAPKLRKPSKH